MRCTYCNSTKELTKDHVIPMQATSNYRHYHMNNTVPACRHCNMMKNNKMFNSYEDICNYLATQLWKKIRKLSPGCDKYNDYIIRFDNLKQNLR